MVPAFILRSLLVPRNDVIVTVDAGVWVLKIVTPPHTTAVSAPFRDGHEISNSLKFRTLFPELCTDSWMLLVFTTLREPTDCV